MNSQNLQSSSRVRDTDIHLAIKAPKSTEGSINAIGPVGRSHHDNITSCLDTVHEGEELGDDTALDFAVGFVTLGCNGIDFVDEDDGGAVLFGFFKGLAQVGL